MCVSMFTEHVKSSIYLKYIYNKYYIYNNNNNKYLLEVLNCTFFLRTKYIIIYVHYIL